MVGERHGLLTNYTPLPIFVYVTKFQENEIDEKKTSGSTQSYTYIHRAMSPNDFGNPF